MKRGSVAQLALLSAGLTPGCGLFELETSFSPFSTADARAADTALREAAPRDASTDIHAQGPSDASVSKDVDARRLADASEGRDVSGICGDMSGLQAGSAWPMPGYCPTRVSQSPFVGPSTLSLKWMGPQVSPNGGQSPLIIAKTGSMHTDYIVLTTEGFDLFALDTTGSLQWMATSQPSLGAVAPGGTVYTYFEYAVAIRSESYDGTESKAIDAGVSNVAGVLLAGGGDLLVTGDVARSLTPAGETVWTLEAGTGPVAVGVDGLAIIPSGNRLLALAPDGGVVWKSVDVGGNSCTPLVGPDLTVYSMNGNTLSVVNPGTGAIRRQFSAGIAGTGAYCGFGVGLALGPDGTLYVRSTGVTPGDAGGIVAIDTKQLAVKWSYPTHSAQAPTVGADGVIYFGTEDGYVYALAPDGGLKSKLQIGTPIISQPALGKDGTLYVTAIDPTTKVGSLYAIGP